MSLTTLQALGLFLLLLCWCTAGTHEFCGQVLCNLRAQSLSIEAKQQLLPSQMRTKGTHMHTRAPHMHTRASQMHTRAPHMNTRAPHMHTTASGLLWCLQTSFKRAAPTSAPDTGGNGCPEAAEVIDWDNVKPDDKTLVFQVSLLPAARLPTHALQSPYWFCTVIPSHGAFDQAFFDCARPAPALLHPPPPCPPRPSPAPILFSQSLVEPMYSNFGLFLAWAMSPPFMIWSILTQSFCVYLPIQVGLHELKLHTAHLTCMLGSPDMHAELNTSNPHQQLLSAHIVTWKALASLVATLFATIAGFTLTPLVLHSFSIHKPGGGVGLVS